MVCLLTKSLHILASMIPQDDFRQSPEQASLLSQMLNSKPVVDLATVNAANVGALAISLSEAEQWIRVTSCSLAAIYTCLKIVELMKSFKK